MRRVETGIRFREYYRSMDMFGWESNIKALLRPFALDIFFHSCLFACCLLATYLLLTCLLAAYFLADYLNLFVVLVMASASPHLCLPSFPRLLLPHSFGTQLLFPIDRLQTEMEFKSLFFSANLYIFNCFPPPLTSKAQRPSPESRRRCLCLFCSRH